MSRSPLTYNEKPLLVPPPMTPLQKRKTPLHEQLGVTPEYTRYEYMKIVNQDENLAIKLKAIAPLAREIGLELDSDSVGTTNNIIFMLPPEISDKHNIPVIHEITPDTDTPPPTSDTWEPLTD